MTDSTTLPVQGTEHWTNKGDIKLFLWEKRAVGAVKGRGTILFVHGSSMASQPTFRSEEHTSELQSH